MLFIKAGQVSGLNLNNNNKNGEALASVVAMDGEVLAIKW